MGVHRSLKALTGLPSGIHSSSASSSLVMLDAEHVRFLGVNTMLPSSPSTTSNWGTSPRKGLRLAHAIDKAGSYEAFD